MNEHMKAAMLRKVRNSYLAAMAMGEKCDVCGKLFQPHDEGCADGVTMWVVTCCGKVRHYEQIDPEAQL